MVPIVAALAFTGAAALATSAYALAPRSVQALPAGVAHTMPDGAAPDQQAAGEGTLRAPGIPIGREALEKIKEDAASAGASLTAAGVSDAADNKSGGPSQQVLLKNCNAQAAAGFAPSDSHGAAGGTNIVTVSNVVVQVQNKSTCAIVSSQNLTAFFAPVGVAAGTTLFDPRVVWDRAHSRFFLTAESETGSNDDQFQYFAVSQNSLGTSWFLYRITLSQGASRFCKKATTSFWDYPNAGYNRTRWLITANDFCTTVTGALLDINSAPTLTGGATTVACFINLPTNLAPPIVIDTATVMTLLSPGSGSGSTIQRRNLNVSVSGPASDTISTIANVNIAAWTAPPNAAQPNGTTLDTLDGRFQSASIQSRGLLWNVHAVTRSTGSGNRSIARVYKLSQSSAVTTPNMTLSLHTATSGEDHIFNPSFATGSGAFNAPAFMTASRTVPTITPGTGGNATTVMFQGLNSSTDTANDWLFNTIVVSATQFSGCSPCRWGDYSATQVDTSTLGKAWGWNQFVTGASQFNWQIRAAQIELNLSTAPTPAAASDE